MQGQGSAVKDWRALPGCYPSIFGKNAGAGQKIGERYRSGATPLSLANMQGQGMARQCSKKFASATTGGLPLIFGKNATAGGLPLYLWEKMQGQGSAVKSWSALLGTCRGRAVQ